MIEQRTKSRKETIGKSEPELRLSSGCDGEEREIKQRRDNDDVSQAKTNAVAAAVYIPGT